VKILVTGGAGYIGSHTCLELLGNDYEVVVVDNLSNSKEESLKRVMDLAGKRLEFYKMDLLDKVSLNKVFGKAAFDAVIHFAGLKAVGESVNSPLKYYTNNVAGTIALCEVMIRHNIKNLIFSSSCTVYGNPHKVPITEDFPLLPTNPYGRTKLIIEDILRDLHRADHTWNVALLRYFNPVGAHKSGRIGEDPNGIPNNLFPFISQVAVGKFPFLSVFGDDYTTPDGTGIRDYIHITDLALGHLKALKMLSSNPGVVTYNLGTGSGYSVLEIVTSFEKAAGKKIPYRITGRRPGDIALAYADPSLAKKELGWTAERGLDEMCADSWKWQINNPNGYE
jgi:UDP-glucose 4-epimerase